MSFKIEAGAAITASPHPARSAPSAEKAGPPIITRVPAQSTDHPDRAERALVSALDHALGIVGSVHDLDAHLGSPPSARPSTSSTWISSRPRSRSILESSCSPAPRLQGTRRNEQVSPVEPFRSCRIQVDPLPVDQRLRPHVPCESTIGSALDTGMHQPRRHPSRDAVGPKCRREQDRVFSAVARLVADRIARTGECGPEVLA